MRHQARLDTRDGDGVAPRLAAWNVLRASTPWVVVSSNGFVVATHAAKVRAVTERLPRAEIWTAAGNPPARGRYVRLHGHDVLPGCHRCSASSTSSTIPEGVTRTPRAAACRTTGLERRTRRSCRSPGRDAGVPVVGERGRLPRSSVRGSRSRRYVPGWGRCRRGPGNVFRFVGFVVGDEQRCRRTVRPAIRDEPTGLATAVEGVHPSGNNLRRAAVVDRESDDLDPRELRLDLDEQGWVGAVESVDRLRRIADEEQVVTAGP